MLLALLFSTLIAVSLAIVADLLNNVVRDPEQIERTLSTEVIGTLPVVTDWQGAVDGGGRDHDRAGAKRFPHYRDERIPGSGADASQFDPADRFRPAHPAA